MKKRGLIILLITCILTASNMNNAYGQELKENQWLIQPRFGSRAALFSLAYLGAKVVSYAFACDYPEIADKYRWLPISNFYIDMPVSMTTPEGKIEFEHGNFWKRYLWGFDSYSFGFEVSWRRVLSPVDFFFDCDYKHYELKMRFPNEESFGKYTTQSIVPALGIRYKFGDFINEQNTVIELGAGYNYNIGFKGKYDNSTNVVNNGIVGIYGIGTGSPSTKVTVTLRYQMNHYNYFNENYTPDNGATYPFKGVKSTIGCFSLAISKMF